MVHKSLFFLFSCLFWVSGFCVNYCLSKQDIGVAVEEMLSYHVDYKKLTPALVKRSFRVFIDHFDPHRMYFLQSELAPFWNLSEEKLAQVALAYKRGDYSRYEELNRTIYSAIMRARDLREEIRKELLREKKLEIPLDKDEGSFPKSEALLKGKMRRYMVRALFTEKQMEHVDNLSEIDKEKILNLLEKRLCRLEEEYIHPDDEHFLAMHLLKAFAKSLDAHSSFFTPEEARDLRMSLEKHFEGIGVILREGIQGIVVKEVVPGGPAAKSKLVGVGDQLVAVDGRMVDVDNYSEVMQWLKGVKGQKLVLTLRKSDGKEIKVPLVRDKIVLESGLLSYAAIPYADGIIGIVNLPAFYESTDGSSCEKDLKDALRKLRSKGTVYGLIIDMRENTGGFLSQAVKVASLFISSGVVVVSKYSEGQMQYLRNIDGRIFYEGPLILLTSKMSASAAEIVAQSLQDYGIALVVGDERTYGKGTIQYQTVTEEDASTYFKVTVGRYYTVSGKSTQIEGVKADLVVPSRYAPFNIGEKYLPYALKNDQIAPVFLDPLEDIETRSQSWFEKNYIPNLQKKFSFWTEILPVLRENSAHRIQYDKDFLCFLEFLKTDPAPLEKKWTPSVNFGMEDLQIMEAIHIIKDMSLLQKYAKNKKSS